MQLSDFLLRCLNTLNNSRLRPHTMRHTRPPVKDTMNVCEQLHVKVSKWCKDSFAMQFLTSKTTVRIKFMLEKLPAFKFFIFYCSVVRWETICATIIPNLPETPKGEKQPLCLIYRIVNSKKNNKKKTQLG